MAAFDSSKVLNEPSSIRTRSWVCLVGLVIWLKETNQINQINQKN